MFALLFDRRSLTVTGLALTAIGVLLFTAGLVTGLTLRRERTVVPPRWVEYGPVEVGDLRPGDRRAALPTSIASPTAPGEGASPGGAAVSGGTAAPGAAAVPDATTLNPGPPTDGEPVPFAAPGDPEVEDSPSGGASDGSGPATEGSDAVDTTGVALPRSAPPGTENLGTENLGTATPYASANAPPRQIRSRPKPAMPAMSPEPARPEVAASDLAARAVATRGSAPRANDVAASEAAPHPGCASEEGWFVQAGAYAVAANARQRGDAIQARFASDGFSESAQPYFQETQTAQGVGLTLVRVGPFSSRRQAQRMATRLGDAFVGRQRTSPGCGSSPPTRNDKAVEPLVTPVGIPGG